MTTEFHSEPPIAAEQPGSIGAAADIYRKLDRRPRGSMQYAAPVIATAIILAGSAAAYMMLKPGATPHSTTPPAQQTAQAPAPQTQPAPAVNVVETPPSSEALTARPRPLVHQAAPASRLAAQTVRPRAHRAAQNAASSGEDANAYTPPAPVTAPPAATTAAPPAAAQTPAPATLPPPPAAPSSAAPAQSPS